MTSSIVSVIVPTKDSARTLEACLASIKQQTYPSIELIVVDNFSKDDTPQIAQQFTDKFFSQGPERSTQRNFAVSQATGKYVCIIDSDMALDPHVIEDCVAAMKKGISGVVIPEESFGKGFWAQCKRLERSFYVGVAFMEAARFFRRSDFVQAGGYDTALISGEDWELSQRMESIGRIARITSYIHHDEGRISLTKTVRKKFYYALHFSRYAQSSHSKEKIKHQTGIFSRYWLFLSQPGRLFHNPIIGIGMLYMKTCEFLFGGIALFVAKVQQK